jgi:YbgC/YbaW family acyl-CoA thioester hydrolase
MSTGAPRTYETSIQPEWIDEYEHMNVAHYITVCDQATWAFWHIVNGDRQMDERDGHEYVVLETHVNYISELSLGTAVYVTTQLLACDDKRFVIFHRLCRSDDDSLSATVEVKGIGFDLAQRRIEPFTAEVREAMASMARAHASFGVPEAAGRGIALKKVTA